MSEIESMEFCRNQQGHPRGNGNIWSILEEFGRYKWGEECQEYSIKYIVPARCQS